MTGVIYVNYAAADDIYVDTPAGEMYWDRLDDAVAELPTMFPDATIVVQDRNGKSVLRDGRLVPQTQEVL